MAVHDILVATFARPNFLLIERATRSQGVPCVQVDLTADAVSRYLDDSRERVVVVDAIQHEDKALEVCKGITAKYPGVRALVLAGRSDIATVAKAIRCGASNYFLLHTPIEELMEIVAGICHTPSGQSLNVRDAITQCCQLGLTPEGVAEQLRLPPDAIQKVLANNRPTRRSSWLTRLGDVLPDLKGSTTTSERSSLKPLLGVLLTVALLGVGWRLLARESPAHYLSGTVTFSGSPLKCGLIRFIPEEAGGSPRPIVAGEIRDGTYRLKSGHGSDGGSYRVVISGFTGIPKQDGPVTNPLGDQLFPDVTRTTGVPCSDFVFDAQCD
ncbi:MAG: hypothetical protein EBS90_12100 [Betaproteobacteria bacterium]|nr:hypothetical protein [Betaproteobacteria bacterium]